MNETEYLAELETARHLYLWCLVTLGGYSAEEATKKATKIYMPEPAELPFRELVLHDPPWKWAMRQLHGECYWIAHPELSYPCEEYNREADRIERGKREV